MEGLGRCHPERSEGSRAEKHAERPKEIPQKFFLFNFSTKKPLAFKEVNQC